MHFDNVYRLKKQRGENKYIKETERKSKNTTTHQTYNREKKKRKKIKQHEKRVCF